MILTDANGNELTEEQHKDVKIYIFYDQESFSKQAMKQYERAVEKYGEGAVALSAAVTEKEFSQDWGDMAGKSIETVNLDYHGSNQALHLDPKNRKYIVSTGTGKTRFIEYMSYELGIPLITVSSVSKENIDYLKSRRLLDELKLIRIYSKVPGKAPDLDNPFILPKGSSLLDFALQVHHDFADNLKFARVWGSSKFDGQHVDKYHILEDCDIVELHL